MRKFHLYLGFLLLLLFITSCKKEYNGDVSVWWQKPFYDSCKAHSGNNYLFYINGASFGTNILDGNCSGGINCWGCVKSIVDPHWPYNYNLGSKKSQVVTIKYECRNNANQVTHTSTVKSFIIQAGQCNSFEFTW